MNQTHNTLSNLWHHIESDLFPWIVDVVGPLTELQNKFVQAIEVSKIEKHLSFQGNSTGRPPACSVAIARAFVAKAIYNLPTTKVLIDHLKSSVTLRRLCGWEKHSDIPCESTFSRAAEEFSLSELAERTHASVIET